MTNALQLAVFLGLTGLVGLITYLKCRAAPRSTSNSKEYFLAGGTLSWPFVAGSILLTNISAEQIVVHPDLANIIKQYTKATIRKAPVGVDEILEWSSQYFKEKAEEDNKKRLAALKIEGEEDA